MTFCTFQSISFWQNVVFELVGKGIKKSKKSTNEPDISQAFDDDDDLDVDYQEVDKAEKQYYDFEKFLKAEQELAMARMKFAEKRMR